MNTQRLNFHSNIILIFTVIFVLGLGWGCNGSNTEGCRENTDCEVSEYCEKEAGDCSGTGECLPISEVCPDIWNPVCGCDGLTYGNACEAQAVGINIASEGECPPPPCSENEDCLADEYCDKAVGDCAGEGECLPMPTNCIILYDPVCGCDGSTYGNACTSAAAGVNIAQEGECPQPSCTQNSDCAVTEYCDKVLDDCDGVGECLTLPLACPDVWNPVCGCDGTTYGNECEAQAAGINVVSAGVCPAPACTNNNDCAAGEYCGKAQGDCDSMGECLPKPLSCIMIWDPVCGCDGNTYNNDCEAAVAGVNVVSTGECPQSTCTSNLDCTTGLYCEKAVGDCAGEGECLPSPQSCPDFWAPVCGCDGKTYGNACEAAAAHVNIVTTGACL